jgi:hypothetical protein
VRVADPVPRYRLLDGLLGIGCLDVADEGGGGATEANDAPLKEFGTRGLGQSFTR